MFISGREGDWRHLQGGMLGINLAALQGPGLLVLRQLGRAGAMCGGRAAGGAESNGLLLILIITFD